MVGFAIAGSSHEGLMLGSEGEVRGCCEEVKEWRMFSARRLSARWQCLAVSQCVDIMRRKARQSFISLVETILVHFLFFLFLFFFFFFWGGGGVGHAGNLQRTLRPDVLSKLAGKGEDQACHPGCGEKAWPEEGLFCVDLGAEGGEDASCSADTGLQAGVELRG